MYAAIIGSRRFNDYKFLKEKIEVIRYTHDINGIVSGGAKGADLLGKQYAYENGLNYIEFLPDWKKYGRAAGFIRNKDIINTSDIVIAFWDGKSKGTKHSIDYAQKHDMEVYIYEII